MPQNYIALFEMMDEAEISARLQSVDVRIEELSQAIAATEMFEMPAAKKFEYKMTKWVEWLYNGFLDAFYPMKSQ